MWARGRVIDVGIILNSGGDDTVRIEKSLSLAEQAMAFALQKSGNQPRDDAGRFASTPGGGGAGAGGGEGEQKGGDTQAALKVAEKHQAAKEKADAAGNVDGRIDAAGREDGARLVAHPDVSRAEAANTIKTSQNLRDEYQAKYSKSGDVGHLRQAAYHQAAASGAEEAFVARWGTAPKLPAVAAN